MNFDLAEPTGNSAVIKVIGVGGGGGNAITHMTATDVEGVEFVCANTDSQALATASATTTLQLGPNVTRGLGAGANPEVGRNAAMEDREAIAEAIQAPTCCSSRPAWAVVPVPVQRPSSPKSRVKWAF